MIIAFSNQAGWQMSDEDFSTPPTHGQLSLGPAGVQEEMKMREGEGGKQHLS